MTSVWRIVKEKYADIAFDGEGARLYGGRWNHPGFPAVYCSETLALAALELFVQLDAAPNMSLVAIEASFSDEISIETLEKPPKNWNHYPLSIETQNLGSEWIKEEKSTVLKVPSVIISREFNYILNPRHTDFNKIKIHKPTVFTFDARMYKIGY